jgi:hypothetical protein
MANEAISSLPVSIAPTPATDYLPIIHYTGTGDTNYTTQRVTINNLFASVSGTPGNPGGTTGELQYNNYGLFDGFTVTGDGTLTPAAGLTITDPNLAAIKAIGTPANETLIAGNGSTYVSQTYSEVVSPLAAMMSIIFGG